MDTWAIRAVFVIITVTLLQVFSHAVLAYLRGQKRARHAGLVLCEVTRDG